MVLVKVEPRPVDFKYETFFRELFENFRKACQEETVEAKEDKTDDQDISQTINNDSEYRIEMDLKEFTADEVRVKIVERKIHIEAKHEDKKTAQGISSRHYVGKYDLPAECNPQEVTSTMSADGVLTVRAPKKQLDPKRGEERVIPITMVKK